MNMNPVSYQTQIKEKERLFVLSGKLGVDFNGLGFVDVDPELGSRMGPMSVALLLYYLPRGWDLGEWVNICIEFDKWKDLNFHWVF